MEGAFLNAAQIWAIASAAGVAAIGLFSILGGRPRTRGALAFGLFALAWGAQILLGTLSGRQTSDAWADRTYLIFLACSALVTYFLIEFAIAQVPRLTLRWRLARTFGIASASLLVLVLLVNPGLLFGGFTDGVLSRGPYLAHLVVFPQFIAFGIALLALSTATQLAPTARTATRYGTLLAGLALYVAFTSGYYFVTYLASWALYPTFGAGPYVVIFTLMVGICATLAIRFASGRHAGAAADRTRGLILACTLAVPLVWGACEAAIALVAAPYLLTVGLWRLAGVGVIAYGLARWRLFDLPQRATRTAATAAGASSSLVSGIAVYGFGTLLTASTLLPALLGFAVVGATFIPGVRFARRLFENLGRGPGTETPDERLYGQRVESYRAALEASLARGSPDEDRDFLDALRERFGISEAEDRLLRYYARSAVLVPKSGDNAAVYERLRLLGEGGAGRTWLARDRVRDRLVVLKEPIQKWQRESHLREQVLREARLAARVRHPHVVIVEEVVEDKGIPIIVMEHLEGGSLAESLRERGVLPWREAIDLTVKVLRGVEAIHQAGIVHRDLKPSNVLLANDGTPKIADFGIAIPITSDKTVVDGSTSFSGTLSYVAPEVRAGASGDRRSDVYSAAALLHECLHGSPPGPHAPVLAQNEVPARVSTILARALHDDPAVRPQTARALADELLSVVRS